MMSKYECYHRFFRPSDDLPYRFRCPGCVTGNCPLYRSPDVCLVLQDLAADRLLLTWNDVTVFVEDVYANS